MKTSTGAGESGVSETTCAGAAAPSTSAITIGRTSSVYGDLILARKKRLYLERTKYLIEYFTSHPCVDCGERDPVVLEFDHLVDKAFDIGAALPYREWKSILDEMEKCEVVCRNCHRRRESRRTGALRVQLTELP